MMLEEAGVEAVGTVIATLKPPDRGEFAAQVDGLVSLRGYRWWLTEAGLALDPAGNLYDTALLKGAYRGGVVFKMYPYKN